MALDAGHQVGETGHTADHNLIDNELTRLAGLVGTGGSGTSVADGSITEAKLAPAVTTKLNAVGGTALAGVQAVRQARHRGGFTRITAGGATISNALGALTMVSASNTAAVLKSDVLPFFKLTLRLQLTSGSAITPVWVTNTSKTLPALSPLTYLRVRQTATQVFVEKTVGSTVSTVGSPVTISGAYDLTVQRRLGEWVFTVTPSGGTATVITVAYEDLDQTVIQGHCVVAIGDADLSSGGGTLVVSRMLMERNPADSYADLRTVEPLAPVITTTDAFSDAVLATHLSNTRRDVRAPAGILSRPYLQAGHDFYNGLFAWDTYWATLIVKAAGAVGLARGWWLGFLDNAETTGAAAGRIPQLIGATDGVRDFYGAKYANVYAAQACHLLSGDGDVSWFDYGKLKAHITYWENNKRSARGLYIATSGLETGWDNFRALNPNQTNPEPVNRYEWIGHSGQMVREYEAMAELAAAKGVSADVTLYRSRATDLKALIASTAYDAAQQWFPAYDVTTNTFSTYLHPDAVWALYCGAATQEQAQAVRDRIMDPAELLGRYGIRSLPATDPQYRLTGTGIYGSEWNGPVWEPVQYLAAAGLARYGFTDDALEIAKRAIDRYRVVLDDTQNQGLPGEWSHPDTGQRLDSANVAYHGWHGLMPMLETYVRGGVFPSDIGPINPQPQPVRNLAAGPAGVPSGTVDILDTFTRADSATVLGTPETVSGGQSWTTVGTWGISGSKAYAPLQASTEKRAGLFVSGTPASTLVKANITLSSVSALACLFLRGNGVAASGAASTALLFKLERFGTTNAIRISKFVSGTETDLVMDTAAGLTLGSTYAVTCHISSAGALTLYLDGVARLTYTLTSAEQTTFATSLTWHGMRTFSRSDLEDGGSRWDNFQVEIVG